MHMEMLRSGRGKQSSNMYDSHFDMSMYHQHPFYTTMVPTNMMLGYESHDQIHSSRSTLHHPGHHHNLYFQHHDHHDHGHHHSNDWGNGQRWRNFGGNPGNPILLERAERSKAVDGGHERSDSHSGSPPRSDDDEVVQCDEASPASDEYGPYQANLFVFHLPTSMDNFTFYSLFRNYGTVLSARIMVNYKTGLSRGFGFISMSTAEEAKSAIEGMNGFVVGRKRLKVQLKRSNTSMSAFYAASGKPSLLSEMGEKVSEREVEGSPDSGVTTRASSPVGGGHLLEEGGINGEPLNNDS